MEYYRLRKLPDISFYDLNEVYFDEKCQVSCLQSLYPISIQNIDYGVLKELWITDPTQDFMTFAFNTFINLEIFKCDDYVNPNVEKLTQKNLKLKHLTYRTIFTEFTTKISIHYLIFWVIWLGKLA